MRKLGVLLLLVSAGCASAPIKKADELSLVQAQTRVLEGCYRCLIEARDVFERIAVGKARPLVVVRLFETYVLIGLRERELALDSSQAFGKARALAAELPPTYVGLPYVDLAEMIPPDLGGTPRTELSPFMQRAPASARLKELRSGLTAGEASAPFRTYLSASLDCLANFANRRDAMSDEVPVPAGTPPLVKYRMGTCPVPRNAVLEELLTETPTFVEAGLFIGRRRPQVITAAWVKQSREALANAYDAFPRSSSVTYAMGAMYQIVGDCTRAVRFYEDTIALKERHEDAALQRVVCLGHVGQFVPAIEGATRVIDRGYYNLADGYYWRAWNHHRRLELDQARADIEKARSMMVNVQVLTLGGVIKYDQNDLVPAERDLNEALRMDLGQCIAHWYLGLVTFKKEAWSDGAARFGASAACYESSANDAAARLDVMRKSDFEEEFKASQIAGFEAVIKEDRDQQWAAILNAANAFARAGQSETALKWIDRIPADAVLASKAAELRKLIIGKFGGNFDSRTQLQ
jgi:tetratricopeptide (TPR) repeat protein